MHTQLIGTQSLGKEPALLTLLPRSSKSLFWQARKGLTKVSPNNSGGWLPTKIPLLGRSCRHHQPPVFSTLHTGSAISRGCKQVRKSHLAFASAVSWDGRAGKITAELSCYAVPSSAAAGPALHLQSWRCWVPCKKSRLLKKEKSSTKA